MNTKKLIGYLLIGFIIFTTITICNIQRELNAIDAITQSNSETVELNCQMIDDMLKTK